MKSIFSGKRGQAINTSLLWSMVILSVVLGISGIVAAFTADITDDVGDDFEANSYGANITDNSLEAQDTVAGKFNTVGLIAMVVIIISLLMGVVGGLGLVNAYR